MQNEPTSGPKFSESGKQSWRFSLRGLMLAVALVLVVLSHFKVTSDLNYARSAIKKQDAEMDRLQEQLGLFVVEEQSKPHVHLALKTPDSYRWRVYLPPRDQDYEICVSEHGIADTSVPQDGFQRQWLKQNDVWVAAQQIDGTFTVDVFLWKDDKGWQWHIRHPAGEMFVPLARLGTGGRRQEHFVAQGLKIFEPSEPVELLRIRQWKHEELVGDQPTDELTNGIIVWIQ